jgi:hypothetical protein
MKPNLLKLGTFALLGSLGGFAYYHFIGCSSGTCPITSNPFISTGYGAMMGIVLGWSGKKSSVKTPINNTIEPLKK